VSITFDTDGTGVMTMPNGTTSTIKRFFNTPTLFKESGVYLPYQFKNFHLLKTEISALASNSANMGCHISLTVKNNSNIDSQGLFYFLIFENNILRNSKTDTNTVLFNSDWEKPGATFTLTARTYATAGKSCSDITVKFWPYYGSSSNYESDLPPSIQ
jgi:hypothetical protein